MIAILFTVARERLQEYELQNAVRVSYSFCRCALNIESYHGGAAADIAEFSTW